MGLKSYTNGAEFEKQLSHLFSKLNFYVIYNSKKVEGSQPFDLLVIKNNKAYAYECKTLENKNGLFPISRVEHNQLLAYERFRKCNNTNMCLAILWNDNVYYINFDLLPYFDKHIDLKKVEPNIKNWSLYTNDYNS